MLLGTGFPLSLFQVSSVEEAWQTLEGGSKRRQSAETKMNDRSSRSHCMLCVKVRGQSKLTGLKAMQNKATWDGGRHDTVLDYACFSKVHAVRLL